MGWSLDILNPLKSWTIAIGSSLECAGCLDVARIKTLLTHQDCHQEKHLLCEILSREYSGEQTPHPGPLPIRWGYVFSGVRPSPGAATSALTRVSENSN